MIPGVVWKEEIAFLIGSEKRFFPAISGDDDKVSHGTCRTERFDRGCGVAVNRTNGESEKF